MTENIKNALSHESVPSILTEEEKDQLIKNAAVKFGEFLTELKFDWKNDPNMIDTPNRVAKMYVKEICRGRYLPEPKITVFEGSKYDGMVFEGAVNIKSLCSHHLQHFYGLAYIAYIPNGNSIIGLSKLNRIADYFARRPQVQENLTMQIYEYLNKILPGNGGIAIELKCKHMCVSMRGVEHDSNMITSKLSGAFIEREEVRKEFYNFINQTQN